MVPVSCGSSSQKCRSVETDGVGTANFAGVDDDVEAFACDRSPSTGLLSELLFDMMCSLSGVTEGQGIFRSGGSTLDVLCCALAPEEDALHCLVTARNRRGRTMTVIAPDGVLATAAKLLLKWAARIVKLARPRGLHINIS